MLRRNPFAPLARGSTATLVLLGLALLLAGVVGWRARTAARAHQAAVRRLLQDHAGYAAAEFTRRAGSELDAATAALQFPAPPPVDGVPLPPVQEYAARVRAQDARCRCLAAARDFFRLDLRTGALSFTGQAAGPQTARWLRDQVAAHGRWLAEHPADDERLPPAQVRTVDGRPTLLAFTVLLDARDTPRAAYGVVQDPASLAAPLFRRVMAAVPLLPASLVRGVANDSLVVVSVTGPDGAELWRSGPAEWSAAAAVEPFPEAVTGLSARVEVRPGAAPRLLREGIPESPQPLLLGLMVVTLGVVAVAFLQLRRQHALARMRADFVSGVSHELRTPITQIRLWTDLLMTNRLRTDEERRHSLHLVDREARRLTFLVERILDFSRSERGTLTIEASLQDAEPIVREVLEGFEPVARARGMSLRPSLGPGLVARLDDHALRHVLLNFLENAVKYGPAGQVIQVGAERRDGALRVWVEDGGPGVPPDQRRRVWEPYYRVDRAVDRVVGGSGIGLSLVRDLVERHGGRTWVEDGEWRGARFVAEFPAGAPERTGAADSPGKSE